MRTRHREGGAAAVPPKESGWQRLQPALGQSFLAIKSGLRNMQFLHSHLVKNQRAEREREEQSNEDYLRPL
jgi:hypothetical protein